MQSFAGVTKVNNLIGGVEIQGSEHVVINNRLEENKIEVETSGLSSTEYVDQLDSENVKLAGVQKVTGVKQFSGQIHKLFESDGQARFSFRDQDSDLTIGGMNYNKEDHQISFLVDAQGERNDVYINRQGINLNGGSINASSQTTKNTISLGNGGFIGRTHGNNMPTGQAAIQMGGDDVLRFYGNGNSLIANFNNGKGDTVASIPSSGEPTSPIHLTSKSYVDDAIERAVGEQFFPVGSVVFRMDTINPGSIYGGTWALITGDASLSFGDGTTQNGSLTGSNTVPVPVPLHHHSGTIGQTNLGTKTTNTTGSHSHTVSWRGNGTNAANLGGGDTGTTWRTATSNSTGNHSHTVAMGSHGHTISIEPTGTDSAAVNTRGARIAINVWQRTA